MVPRKNSNWINNLEYRKIEEINFHNLDREKKDDVIIQKQKDLDIHANRKFYSITNGTREFILNWIAINSKGKVFLDYACGDGSFAMFAAKEGSSIAIGIDISDVSINNAIELKLENKIENCHFLQADCENTELPDNCIDVVLCSGMLHHLDLNKAFPELKRILRQGGVILCVEALSVNPVIQWYRDRTPEMRTDWEKEHILGMKDVKFAKKFFAVKDVKYWYLFEIIAAFFQKSFLFKPLQTIFKLIDKVVLKIPYIQRLSWQFTFVLQKK